MKLSRILTSAMLGLALGSASLSAFAAAAMAVGNDNYSYTVTEAPSVEQAKQEALQGCSQKVDGCRVAIWTSDAGALAIAKGSGGYSAAVRKDPREAYKAVMAGCAKAYKGCKFAAIYWEPGGYWASWAHAEDAQGVMLASFFHYEDESREKAEEGALAGCRENLEPGDNAKCIASTRYGDWAYVKAQSKSYTRIQLDSTKELAVADALRLCKENSKPGDACKIVKAYVNRGPAAEPAVFKQVYAMSAAAKAEQASPRAALAGTRAAQTLTCTNSCVNGQCVRTFADGRKERWQAPRVFDPFTNNWKWDTNSCGG